MKNKKYIFLAMLGIGLCINSVSAQQQTVLSKDSVANLKKENEVLKVSSKINSLKLTIADEQKKQVSYKKDIEDYSKKSLKYTAKAGDNSSAGIATSDRDAKKMAKDASEAQKYASKVTKLHSKVKKSEKKVEKLNDEIGKLSEKLSEMKSK